MKNHLPKCGHSSLHANCELCEKFKQHWYSKIKNWHDIEYGLDHPEHLYEPVSIDKIDQLTTDFYDRVLDVHHTWVTAGRSKRDCLIAWLYGFQERDSGTERGIVAVLKSKNLKPNSRWTVRQTIKEIDSIVLKKAQGHLSVEQVHSLHPLDSKPNKDEADGKKQAIDSTTSDHNRAAA